MACKVGVIGCGKISDQYLEKMQRFPALEVVACGDLIVERAEAKAAMHGIGRACSPVEIIEDPEIEIVVNLTPPLHHAPVNLSALQAGKHVYTEKPLATDRESALHVLEVAREKDLRVGCAPDSFMGGGLQTARRVVAEGTIGDPVAATAFWASWGPEKGPHPDPGFFFQVGGGPMLDMGPYYVTALVNLLGPARRVSGASRITYGHRVKRREPNEGRTYPVETPTHVTGAIEFAAGPIATATLSFDVPAHGVPCLEVYGTRGTLKVPDPNTYWGPVEVWVYGEEGWREVAIEHGYTERFRGLGVADMARAIALGRPHRAGGQMAYHVLDVLLAFNESARDGRHVEISSSCEIPPPLPSGLRDGELD